MPSYRFYPRADAAQDKIWHDTVDRWGEQQRAAYIRGLHDHLQRLCEDPAICGGFRNGSPFQPISNVKPTSAAMSGTPYFRELGIGDLGAMSILYERVDLPVRLRDDLLALSDKPKGKSEQE